MTGPESTVTALAFSQDGTRVVTAADDRAVRVFDVATGTEILRTYHRHDLTAVTFHAGAEQILVGCRNGPWFDVFDDCTGKHVDLPAIPPDTWSVRTEADGSVCWPTGTEAIRVPHDGLVERADVSADGTRLVVAGPDGGARLYDTVDGTQVARLGHETWEIRRLAWSPDGTRVAAVAWDDSVALIDPAKDTTLLARLPHDDHPGGVAFSADGTDLITADLAGTVRFFAAADGTPLGERRYGGPNHAVQLAPDGTWLALYTRPGREGPHLRVVDTDTGAELSASGRDVRLVLDPARAVTRHGDPEGPDRLHIECLPTGNVLVALDLSGNEAVTGSPDGQLLLSHGDDGPLRLLSTLTGRVLHPLRWRNFDPNDPYLITNDVRVVVRAAAFAAAAPRVAVLHSPDDATIFNTDSGWLAKPVGDWDLMRSIAISPDGTHVATGRLDGRVGINNVDREWFRTCDLVPDRAQPAAPSA